MDEDELVHIYTGIFLIHKKEKNDAIWSSNMYGQGDYHAKWSISEDKDKISLSYDIFIIWYHLHVESFLKKWYR